MSSSKADAPLPDASHALAHAMSTARVEALFALEAELSYAGPERRRAPGSALSRLLAAVLDEVDYGLVLLGADGVLIHANHAARSELSGRHPLELSTRRLRGRTAAIQRTLQAALQEAHGPGRRSLLQLGDESERSGVSIVALPAALSTAHAGHAVLITLQRRGFAEKLSVGAYARSHGLSSREEEVLGGLCDGLRPAAIAEKLGISLATVRSHVHHLKQKTGSASVVELLKTVAVLPPMVTGLKHR